MGTSHAGPEETMQNNSIEKIKALSPFENEWKKEMTKLPKEEIIELFSKFAHEKLHLINSFKHILKEITDDSMWKQHFMAAINKELKRSIELHPNYPKDIYHRLAIMQEEAGEVAKAVLDYDSDKGPIEDVTKELIQTAAMCLKMLLNMRETDIMLPKLKSKSFADDIIY